MSGPGRAAVAGGSQGDGGRSRLIGWEAGAEGPPTGRSLVQRIARGDDHLRALVRVGDPRLELAAQVKESHAAFRATVVVRVGARLGSIIKWGQGPLPIVRNLERLAGADIFEGLDTGPILADISESTALERADGNWELAICHLGGPSRPRSLADLTAQFNRHVWPSRAEPKTRAKNWRYWSCAVSWAIARKAVRLLLPMSTDTLKALTWDLITHAASASLIEAVWHAIQARHRQYHLVPPIDGRGELTAWKRSISSVTGRPLSLKLPIHRTIVVRLLAWRPTQVAWNRARLATALATIACLRVSEVAHLQACDLWFDHFTGYGIPGYEGTCAVHVNKRKNDRVRRGHHPALGRAADPELDIVYQLRVWMEALDLRVHPRCRKRREPAARCPWCPPLFPRTRRGRGNVTLSDGSACSPQRMSGDIKFAMSQMGANPDRFSGVSARKGGLSTAIEAGIHEAILFLQTGHGQAKAARDYMHIRDPAVLMQVFEAFKL